MTDKTIEALKLAEALENDAKEHREVSYGLDCPPERTANWQHALNCEAAARLIREVLAEPVKQEPVAWMEDSIELYVSERPSNTYTIPLYAAPVSVEAIRSEALEEAAKVCRTAQAQGLQSIREAIEKAIRGLKESS